jgi:hypothetical protein
MASSTGFERRRRRTHRQARARSLPPARCYPPVGKYIIFICPPSTVTNLLRGRGGARRHRQGAAVRFRHALTRIHLFWGTSERVPRFAFYLP